MANVKLTNMVKLRAWVDAPLRQKGVVFWLLFPVLMLISVVWATVAAGKRSWWHRRRKLVGSVPSSQYLTICCGNVLVGGSGKSPLVRAVARSFLAQGWSVAILSRGFGAKNAPEVAVVTTVDEHNEEANHLCLSDENREHLFLLRENDRPGSVVVVQAKNRVDGMEALHKFVHERGMVPQRVVVILDDGLQSLAVSRHIDLCLWSPSLLVSAPPFSLPVGPYREGFGKALGPWSLAALLNRFNIRLWSRFSRLEWESGAARKQAAAALARFKLSLSSKLDMFIVAKHELCLVDANSNDNNLAESLTSVSKPLLIAGLANPQAFARDVRALLCERGMQNFSPSCYFIADHGEWTRELSQVCQDHDALFLSAKDYFRWFNNPEFLKSTAGLAIFLVRLEVDVFDCAGQAVCWYRHFGICR